MPSGAFSARSGIVAGIGGAVMNVLTVALLIGNFIVDGARLMATLLSVFPQPSRDRLDGVLTRAGKQMRRWLPGQKMLMVILGVASGIAFGLMRIPYFMILAVFAGIANIIPLLGPMATVVLAALAAATEPVGKVLGFRIYYFIYRQVENAFLTPKV